MAFQWLRDIWSEITSGVRWFFIYLLPMGLARPFQSKLFVGVYDVICLALVAGILPDSLGVRPFLRTLIRDIWEKLIGEASYSEFIYLTNRFPTLPILILLLSWGLLVLLWAGRRRKFFCILAANDVQVVRGGGKRMAFLERVRQRGGLTMGLGLTARLQPAYVPRPEEPDILAFLREGPGGRQAVIHAPSTAGKTRTAMELLHALGYPFVILWPSGRGSIEPNAWADLPETGLKGLVFADDVALSGEGQRPAVHAALRALLERGRNLGLLATRVSDELPAEVAGARLFELGVMSSRLLEDLAGKVAASESTAVGEVRVRYTGHPGGLIAAVDAMRRRWEELDLNAQRILQAERALFDEGVPQATFARIRCLLGELWALRPDDGAFEGHLNALKRQGFVSLAKDALRTYQGYRGPVVEPPLLPENLPDRVWAALRACADGDAFLQIGLAAAEEYAPAYQRDPRGRLRRAIRAYEAALEHYTPQAAPLDYATTQNNLGNAYARMAAYEEPVANLRRAVAAYEAALAYRTPEAAPLDYAGTQNNLGLAYGDLAAHEEPVENRDKARRAFFESLVYYRKYLPEDSPFVQRVLRNLAILEAQG